MKKDEKQQPRKSEVKRKVIYRTTLSSLRREKGLTPVQVAAGAGLASEAMVENAERGFGLRLDTALKIAKFFNTPVEAIWSLLPGKGVGK